MSNLLAYRPSVAAIIFDEKARFLLVQLNEARQEEYDFVKGGMITAEDKIATLKREIKEELGSAFKYKIVAQSDWYLIYDWPKDLQERRGFMGQARTSFWVKCLGGEINLNKDELRSYNWFEEKDLSNALLKSGFPEMLTQNLLNEWAKKRADLLS